MQKQEFELDCPSQYVTFHRDKVVYETSKQTYEESIKKIGKLDQREMQERYLDAVNERIGKLLFDCWDQFMQGRVRVLDAYDEERQCVLCARFEFSDEVKQEFMKTTNGLPLELTDFRNDDNLQEDHTLDNYLRSERVKKYDQEITMYQFLLDPLDAYQLPVYDYSFDEPYAIIFSAMNEHNIKSKAEKVWAWITGRDLTIHSGNEEEPEFINVLDLVPYSEVTNRCDSLE
jgi:hypothetical protein